MNTDRLWLAAAVAVMAVIAAAGWFLGVSPIVSSAVAANEQVSTITASNAASLAKVGTLKAQYASIGELQASLDKLRESIPETPNASAFLQELDALGAPHNVTLKTVMIASATVYQAPAAAAGSTATSTSTATPTPTPTPTATTTTTPSTTPSASAVGQFVLVPVVITVTGNFSDIRDFIGAVQGGTRLYLATSVAITAGTGGQPSTGTLTGNIFTLQGTSTPPAGAPVVTPTPTPTPTSTSTPAPTDTAIPTLAPTPTVTPTP